MDNLIEPGAVAAYLARFAPDDPVAARHLETALGGALRKEADDAVAIAAPPDHAPDWLRRRWPRGGPYHRFAPSPELDRWVRHVADCIAAAVADGDARLADTDDRGRPRKLLKLGSLA